MPLLPLQLFFWALNCYRPIINTIIADRKFREVCMGAIELSFIQSDRPVKVLLQLVLTTKTPDMYV